LKKSASALFAIVAVLVFSQVASASTIAVSFTYTNSSDAVVAAGWLTFDTSKAYTPNNTSTGIPATSPGYNVTQGSITVSGNTLPLFVNPVAGTQQTSNDGTYYYDDLLFPDGPSGLYLDYDGLLFGEGTDVVEVNVWGTGSGASLDSLWEDTTTGGHWSTQDNNGTFAIPDGGTTLTLLGLAVAGLAGLRRKLSK